MSKHDFFFPNQPEFDRLFIGFDRLFKSIPEFVEANKYPPYNVIKDSETSTRIEIAVAGFKKSDIKIEVKENVLTVSGAKSTEKEEELDYQYRGLASRGFIRKFKLAEFMEVTGASLEDGILTVKLTQNIPEEAKAKEISID